MIRALLVIAFIVFVAELGILFSTGVLEFNLDPPRDDNVAIVPSPMEEPLIQQHAPVPQAEARSTPVPAPVTPVPTALPPQAILPVSGTLPSAVAAAPTPTLIPSQIFALYDGGEITVTEAKTMLAGLAPQPAATLERGSPRWVGALEEQIHVLVNRERQGTSLESLDWDHNLSAIARSHSRDMSEASFFAHENPAGQSPSRRGIEAGYLCYKNYGDYFTQGIGENIFQAWLYASTTYLNDQAIGQDYLSIEELARQIVAGWMASPGHRANIRNDSYDQQGIGVVVSPEERVYVTQNFC